MPTALFDRTKFVLSICFWEHRLPDPGHPLRLNKLSCPKDGKRAPLKRRGGFGAGLKSCLLSKYSGKY